MTNLPWIARKEAARQATMAYLKSGKSRWIDVAFDEGWSSILRDWVQHSIFEHARVEGTLPTLARIDQLFSNIDRETHRMAVGSRVRLNAEIERQILVARGRETDISYIPTDELAKRFKEDVAIKSLPPEAVASLQAVDRPAFEAMQRNSPNRELHSVPMLTERSRRMMGDRE